MALTLNTRYGARATEPSIDYPTGGFKNKSAPDAVDGTPLERDWANDFLGARDAILKAAGILANGATETAEASQVLGALNTLYKAVATTLAPGIVELATPAETLTGTDQSKVPAVASVAGLFPFRGIQVYDTAGVFTWAVPAGVTKAWVTVVGGGGGGGKGSPGFVGGGGGEGGTSIKLVDLTGVGSVSVTVGAGGLGRGVGSADGLSGGASSFGAYLSAGGGLGGRGAGNEASGGSPGLGSGGDINMGGAFGQNGVGEASAARSVGGNGGGRGGRGSMSAQFNAVGPGGGGGGIFGIAPVESGNGAAGIVIIQW